MIIQNLIQQQLIKPGTWVGVRAHKNHKITHMWRVHDCVIQDQHVTCWNPQNNQLLPVHVMCIHEVDGMNLMRFCEQADLDAQGCKKPPKTRRGRKPKHMAPK